MKSSDSESINFAVFSSSASSLERVRWEELEPVSGPRMLRANRITRLAKERGGTGTETADKQILSAEDHRERKEKAGAA